MNYGKLTAGTTKTAIDTAKPSEKGEIITYLSRMGDVLHNIQKRGKLTGFLTVTVNTIIDCYKSNFLFSKQNVSEKTYLQMISADSGHIFADTGSDFSVFNTFNKSVP